MAFLIKYLHHHHSVIKWQGSPTYTECKIWIIRLQICWFNSLFCLCIRTDTKKKRLKRYVVDNQVKSHWKQPQSEGINNDSQFLWRGRSVREAKVAQQLNFISSSSKTCYLQILFQRFPLIFRYLFCDVELTNEVCDVQHILH